MEKANQTQEFEYNGFVANGFVMLLVNIAIIVLAGYLLTCGTQIEESGDDTVLVFLETTESTLFFLTGIPLLAVGIIFMKGLSMLEPNEAKVVTFFGRYAGTFRRTGYYWINPLMTTKKVSLRARNLNADPIKVNDKTGNPILIGLVVVWKLKDTYKAIFDIDTEAANNTTATRMNKLEHFVSIQSDSALREVAGLYAYDNEGENKEITLRDGSTEINEVLTLKLNERLEMAGLEVVEARINYLAYAPEIAAVMLRRQQAAAIITAREKIVEGAVSMVRMALDKLSSEDIVTLDEEKKAAMVSNLLVVLCADEPAQPVINSGTLHH